jgi:hypothetical protein
LGGVALVRGRERERERDRQRYEMNSLTIANDSQ